MGSKSSSAPAPDPRLVEAQIRSMGIQDDAIKRVMQQSDEIQPLQKEQLQFGLDSARTAYDQSQEDRKWMLDRRGSLASMQDTLVQDAKGFNAESRGNELAGKAMGDVAQSFANADAQQTRSLARMGVNPSSGKALALGNQMATAKALGMAAAGTNARDRARTEGFALTDRATNALSGFPAMSMQATQSGAGFGASGTNIANQGLAGMNSGITAAGQMAGQMGQNATSMFGAQASYKNGADNAAANANPMGALLGAGAQLGAAYIKGPMTSDRRLKQDIEAVGTHEPTGLTIYEFAYKFDPLRRFRGFMADEVRKVMPDAVVTGDDGFDGVNYSMLGFEMTQAGDTP